MLFLLPLAFVSGILTVFSPCVLPILPIILTSGLDGNKKRVKGVITGLVLSFTIISLLLATIVKVSGISADAFRTVAVFMLIVLGLFMVFGTLWQRIQLFIESRWHFKPFESTNATFIGGLFTGVSLGIVWSPCIGPVIATVATLSAIGDFSFSTILLYFTYALGTGVPLYFIATGGTKISTRLSYVKKYNQQIRQIFGVVILFTALFIWSGADRVLQSWTLDNLPKSWAQITTTFEEKFNVSNELKELKGERSRNEASNGTTIVTNVKLQDDFTGAKISKNALIQGCLGKDCIPSIDEPKFETAEEADNWLLPEDRVFAINFNGETKAYPQRILNWHEIVNDFANKTPIAVTFCPLCGSAIAFERRVDGVITEFGVSGKLHNSDLVMYDRYEGNLWQQITGEAIVGPAAQRNETLKTVPIITVDWAQWKREHPKTKVLSIDTGFTRNYSQYPYGTYEENDQLLFGIQGLDRSLHIKAVVYGIELDGKSKAYPEEAFERNQTLTDTIGGTPIQLIQQSDGKIKVTNLETDDELTVTRLFWFAWAAFHPETELYEYN